jgi:type II secretory pathway pseudopilin PulG
MKRRAMTLIEVIFTASLLALVFMVLLSIFPTAMFAVRQTEHRLTANNIAQAILDECRSGPFSNLTADKNVDLTTPGALGDMLRRSNQKSDDGMDFQPTLVVSASPNSATLARSTFCQLKVVVSWKERGQTFHIDRILQLSALNR